MIISMGCSNGIRILLVSFLVAMIVAYNVPIDNRRSVLQKLLWSAVATTTTSVSPGLAHASDESSPRLITTDTLESVYFGAGCFWHMQHEFTQAEKDLLGRDAPAWTSTVGYAGGTRTDKEGRVCYHNLQGIADYGKLGHGEVVNMNLPSDKVVDFSRVFFSLFNPKTKDRVDPMDLGPEYRSLMGLPGGTKHAAYPAIFEAAKQAGFKLTPGKGNDPDTLGKQLIFVYDTNEFPFYQAEIYHQYHNDFRGPAYGEAYNKLKFQAFDEGRLQLTGCPDRV